MLKRRLLKQNSRRFAYSKRKSHNSERRSISHRIGTNIEDNLVYGLSLKDKEQHMHVLGGTGSGKSKFLELLIRQDVQNKEVGLILLDPHGSLYHSVIDYAAHYHPKLAERFVLFNPSDPQKGIVGFNPIVSDTNNIDFIVSSLVSAVLKVSGQYNVRDTPRINRWLTNIFYPLVSNSLTLLEAGPLISTAKDNLDRDLLIESLVMKSGDSNRFVIEDWAMYLKANDKSKMDLIEGPANRIRDLLSSETIRLILGQQNHNLNLSDAMNEGKIVLVNMSSKNTMSKENNKLLGTLLVNEIFRCALNRNDLDPQLKPFHIYIDEFSEYVTRDIAHGLDQTRKYKAFFTLAHQHLSQVKEEDELLFNSVMTNCNNKVVLGGISVGDAEIMAEELYAGYLDLKEVKDITKKTRERHHEDWRKVISMQSSITESDGWNQNDSYSDSTSESKSLSQSRGESKRSPLQHTSDLYQSSKNDGLQNSNSSSVATGYGSSGSVSKTSGESVSYVPFHRIEEVEEIANRTFWSLNEQHYRKVGEIKNQPVAYATIKKMTTKPMKVAIAKVPSVFKNNFSIVKVDSFGEEAIKSNSDCCLSLDDARKQFIVRQNTFFRNTNAINNGIPPDTDNLQLVSVDNSGHELFNGGFDDD